MDEADRSRISSAAEPTAVARKKRRRPAFSCLQCRSRKVRCDRNSPCSKCIQFKSAECTYEPLPQHPRPAPAPEPTSHHSPADPSTTATDTSSNSALYSFNPAAVPTPESSSSASIASLLDRISHLESQLDAQASHFNPPLSRNASLAGDEPGHRKGPYPVRGTRHKTKFLGQSHWMNGSELVSAS